MSIAYVGKQNTLFTGNPSKSFFKAKYSQHTNFGLQKFRIDFDGTKTLRLTEPSTFTFKISRYADLLMDTYLSVTLPHIWSPIYPPQRVDNGQDESAAVYTPWSPYEFRWIENIGAKMIKNISITCGNYTLQEYSGDYLLASVQRDFNAKKQALFNKMSGHNPELFDPANALGRNGNYPNAYSTDEPAGAEPSIRGQVLYVPINAWFCMNTRQSFPLVALQNNELKITIELRPVNELFQIRNVANPEADYPYVAPDFNEPHMQFYQFVQQPPSPDISFSDYIDKRAMWDADIHLNCTYGFLTDCEQSELVQSPQRYMVRQIREYNFYDVTGSNRVELESHGMVSNYLFYFQRSDVNLRNEWSNYSNLDYSAVSSNNVDGDQDGNVETINGYIGPGVNPDGSFTNIQTSGLYKPENIVHVMESMAILIDGAYRENMQPVGVYNLIEKYMRTDGDAPDGLYCYNFALSSSPYSMHPSGAANMSKCSKVEFEFVTNTPPVDPLAQSLEICDPTTGDVIGVNKSTWRLYMYNYNLTIFEESINFIDFIGGNCGLMWAK